MALPSYLGICPYCQSRVAVAAKICVSCGHVLRAGEVQKAAEEKGLYNPPERKPGIRGWFTNRRRAPRHSVQLETQIQPRLLMSVSFADGESGTTEVIPSVKLIGSTRNISETGLAVVLNSLRIESRLITDEGCKLRIVLDIYPRGLVEMEAIAVRSEQLEEKDGGYLIGVCITDIKDSERTRYLEYLASLTNTQSDQPSGTQGLT
ncbi:MAG TPA: PilZ domain-containing protein [Pyrinomonadaceae bacterium]|nr:PilZ domain-containing protein [Pyrinomonadaceae bacterium]